MCCTAALGVPYERVKYRDLTTLSGGQQKRLVLEFLLAGPDEVVLLDKPDNFLDVPGELWLEQRIRRRPRPACSSATTASAQQHRHPRGDRRAGSGRQQRVDPPGRLRVVPRGPPGPLRPLRGAATPLGRGAREAQGAGAAYKIKAEYNDGLASQYRAAQTRLRKFVEKGPPTGQPREQQVRCGSPAAAPASAPWSARLLELVGLMKPFDLEVWYGERVAVLGSNGSGKSHFLRLLAIGGA